MAHYSSNVEDENKYHFVTGHHSMKSFTPFKLDKDFVRAMRDKKDPWSQNEESGKPENVLAALVYYRTYSRNGEPWWKCVQRVVEGTFLIQQRHVLGDRKSWNEKERQELAQEMYRRIFEMKFLPPGRGLWAMGTPIIEEKGLAASLNNCGFITTENIDENATEPFCFLMDASMLGIGVGCDLKGAGKLTIFAPKESSEFFVIPDTREGWVESLYLLLNSYASEGREKIQFDYSDIRKEGVPLKTFGGISSGPKPLKDLLDKVREILDNYVGKCLDSRGIADIINLIGVAVVSGNIRRTAEIIFGEANDKDFLDLKNYEVNPDRTWGWTSNNSVYADLGMDYTEIAQRIKNNGEPGFIWLENARNYSRMRESEKDYKDIKAAGANPCVPGDTWVLTSKGFSQVKDLVGKECDLVVRGKVNHSSKGFFPTGTKELMKITLVNGISLRLTRNHRVAVASRGKGEGDGIEWIEASKLRLSDKIHVNLCSSEHTKEYSKGSYKDGYIVCIYILFHYHYRHYGFDSKLINFDLGPLRKHLGNDFQVNDEQLKIRGTEIRNIVDPFIIRTSLSYNGNDDKIELNLENLSEKFIRGIYDAYRAICDEHVQLRKHILQSFQMLFSIIDVSSKVTIPGNILRIQPETQNSSIIPIKFLKLTKKEKEVFDVTINSSSSTDEDDIDHAFSANGIIVHNCNEQTLEPYELCNLVETFPNHHETLEDYSKTLYFAFLYSKTVTLLPTHYDKTNDVMLRNRRIGVSISGVAQFLGDRSRDELKLWLETGYDKIKEYDNIFSDYFGVPRSLKTTTVKPSGTVSLIAGATPGMHYPISNYYIRRVTLSKESPFVQKLINGGYHVEPKEFDPENSVIVEIPVSVGANVRVLEDVSMQEQFALAAFLQEHWSDNQVSATITFNKDKEGDQIVQALNEFQYKLKGISLLPSMENSKKYEVRGNYAPSVSETKKEKKSRDVCTFKYDPDRDVTHCQFIPDVSDDIIEEIIREIRETHVVDSRVVTPYNQMPYEEITKKLYNEKISNTKPIDWNVDVYCDEKPKKSVRSSKSSVGTETSASLNIPSELQFCDGDSCVL